MTWISTTGFRKITGMKGRIRAVFGGASASKTYSVIPLLINEAMSSPNKQITVVSDTMPNLKGGAMRDFESIMKSFKRWKRDRWKSTISKYEFANGSFVEFVGANEPDRFRGPRRDILYINEANRIDYETFKQLNQRTREIVWLDWNPTAPFWYNTEISGNIKHEWLRLTYLDNESLSDAEIEVFENMRRLAEKPDAKTYDVNYWNVYGLGLTGQIEGACIKDYDIIEEIPDGYYLKGMGLDFGQNDPNAAVLMYQNEEGRVVFDELVYRRNQDTEDLYKIISKYDTPIYADYAWPDTINWLRKLGIRNLFKCKKGPDSIKYGIDLLNEKHVSVTRKSENLITEFNSYAYKKDKDGQLMDGKYEGPDHLVDACRYVMTKSMKKRQIKVY